MALYKEKEKLIKKAKKLNAGYKNDNKKTKESTILKARQKVHEALFNLTSGKKEPHSKTVKNICERHSYKIKIAKVLTTYSDGDPRDYGYPSSTHDLIGNGEETKKIKVEDCLPPKTLELINEIFKALRTNQRLLHFTALKKEVVKHSVEEIADNPELMDDLQDFYKKTKTKAKAYKNKKPLKSRKNAVIKIIKEYLKSQEKPDIEQKEKSTPKEEKSLSPKQKAELIAACMEAGKACGIQEEQIKAAISSACDYYIDLQQHFTAALTNKETRPVSLAKDPAYKTLAKTDMADQKTIRTNIKEINSIREEMENAAKSSLSSQEDKKKAEKNGNAKVKRHAENIVDALSL